MYFGQEALCFRGRSEAAFVFHGFAVAKDMTDSKACITLWHKFRKGQRPEEMAKTKSETACVNFFKMKLEGNSVFSVPVAFFSLATGADSSLER